MGNRPCVVTKQKKPSTSLYSQPVLTLTNLVKRIIYVAGHMLIWCNNAHCKRVYGSLKLTLKNATVTGKFTNQSSKSCGRFYHI